MGGGGGLGSFFKIEIPLHWQIRRILSMIAMFFDRLVLFMKLKNLDSSSSMACVRWTATVVLKLFVYSALGLLSNRSNRERSHQLNLEVSLGVSHLDPSTHT